VEVTIEHPVAARGEVYLVQLDPTRGSEIRKTRPCLLVSPDELNDHLRTVIVAHDDRRGKLIHGAFSVDSRAEVKRLRGAANVRQFRRSQNRTSSPLPTRPSFLLDGAQRDVSALR
jgi:mRNA-degrading endonuclease toxin of MazEF toxin-antitoxin module